MRGLTLVDGVNWLTEQRMFREGSPGKDGAKDKMLEYLISGYNGEALNILLHQRDKDGEWRWGDLRKEMIEAQRYRNEIDPKNAVQQEPLSIGGIQIGG